jgi:hypothetical protein
VLASKHGAAIGASFVLSGTEFSIGEFLPERSSSGSADWQFLRGFGLLKFELFANFLFKNFDLAWPLAPSIKARNSGC